MKLRQAVKVLRNPEGYRHTTWLRALRLFWRAFGKNRWRRYL